MRLTFLGTGTSTGVPQIMCGCEVCRSSDPRDRRLRTSALLTLDNGHNVLIDCGPDFREQMLRCDCHDIRAVLLTHSHYDHVGGIDDMRPYCAKYGDAGLPAYCREDVARDLRSRIPYCFDINPYPGAPSFDIHTILPNKPFSLYDGTEILPLDIIHAPERGLHILGFRIGPLAYVTDCKIMPPSTLETLRGIDTLLLNGLRHETHPSHMNLSEALGVINEVRPRVAYLIHLSHGIGLHKETQQTLPEGVHIAYDGLTIDI